MAFLVAVHYVIFLLVLILYASLENSQNKFFFFFFWIEVTASADDLQIERSVI